MFTGIVRELGRVEAVEGDEAGMRLRIAAPETAAAATLGDSVAVNGACLTAVDVSDGTIAFDAVPETLRRTSLGRLGAGDAINVEPALRAGEPLGGHIVQGHVDGLGTVRSCEPEAQRSRAVAAGTASGKRLTIEVPPELRRYCVEKGSIAVEGVSLTVAALLDEGIAIALVPHTLVATTLGALVPGDPVNLEVDVLAKYVERLLAPRT